MCGTHCCCVCAAAQASITGLAVDLQQALSQLLVRYEGNAAGELLSLLLHLDRVLNEACCSGRVVNGVDRFHALRARPDQQNHAVRLKRL